MQFKEWSTIIGYIKKGTGEFLKADDIDRGKAAVKKKQSEVKNY